MTRAFVAGVRGRLACCSLPAPDNRYARCLRSRRRGRCTPGRARRGAGAHPHWSLQGRVGAVQRSQWRQRPHRLAAGWRALRGLAQRPDHPAKLAPEWRRPLGPPGRPRRRSPRKEPMPKRCCASATGWVIPVCCAVGLGAWRRGRRDWRRAPWRSTRKGACRELRQGGWTIDY